LYSTGSFPLGTSSMDLPMPEQEELADAIGQLREALPDCIDRFDLDNFHNAYSQAYNLIIPVVMALSPWISQFGPSEDYEPVNINELLKHITGIWHKVFDHLLYDRFYRLYYSFRRREFYLVRSRQQIFRDLIRQHPGAEHLAGAPKGGTFIVLYESEENPRVVGDFALPYRCCSEPDCVPLCDDDDFGVRLPLRARPDFVILGRDGDFIIDVVANDLSEERPNLRITGVTDSQIDNNVAIATEHSIIYSVGSFYQTFDYFDYTIEDTDTGETASARVTVILKDGVEIESNCYSLDVLLCWGAANVEQTLGDRGIPVEGTVENQAQDLLDSLRSTAGFLSSDFDSGVFEDSVTRSEFLNCLGIEHNPQDRGGMRILITQYQVANCGGAQSTDTDGCYSTEIFLCWGDKNVIDALNSRQLATTGTITDRANRLLDSVRATGGFTRDEIVSSFLETISVRNALLTCLGIQFDPEAWDANTVLLENYHAEHCGGSVSGGGCYSQEVLACWGSANIRIALGNRNINIGASSEENINLLLDTLRSTNGFVLNEIRGSTLESGAMRSALLNCLGIEHNSNDYAGMETLIVNYQETNCGPLQTSFQPEAATNITFDPATITTNDAVSLLNNRNVRMTNNTTREEMNAILMRNPVLTRSEIDIVTKKSLDGIMRSKGIRVTSSMTKDQMLKTLIKHEREING
ncbi:MAG: hypothetical protein WBH03_11650, partial [Cyclobacteriaceae bacterium]